MKSVKLAATALLLLILGSFVSLQPGSAVASPTTWPEWSCLTFPGTVDEAVWFFETNEGPATLDIDGDGVPCEENGDDSVTECADLPGPQSVAQDYFDQNGGPRNLDNDGDGMACTNSADGYFGDLPGRPASLPNEDEESESQSGDDVVVDLPKTGSGPVDSTSTPISVPLAAAAAVILLAAFSRRQARTW